MTSLVILRKMTCLRSRVRFPVLPWEFSPVGEDPHSDRSEQPVQFMSKAPPDTPHSHISSLISSPQRNCASWASQPQKSVTLRSQPGGETMKCIWTCDGVGGGGILRKNWNFKFTASFLSNYQKSGRNLRPGWGGGGVGVSVSVK
jgi:hypothetical protein